PFKWHGEHQQIARGAGCRIFHARHLSLCTGARADNLCRLLGPSGITRTDDDGLSGARPAQRETGASRAGASDDGNGAAGTVGHTNSGTNDDTDEIDSIGNLIFIREYFVLRSAGIRPISRMSA